MACRNQAFMHCLCYYAKSIVFCLHRYFIEDFSLSIANIQEDDQGSYTCVAQSELDSVEESAVLVMTG